MVIPDYKLNRVKTVYFVAHINCFYIRRKNNSSLDNYILTWKLLKVEFYAIAAIYFVEKPFIHSRKRWEESDCISALSPPMSPISHCSVARHWTANQQARYGLTPRINPTVHQHASTFLGERGRERDGSLAQPFAPKAVCFTYEALPAPLSFRGLL